MNRVGSAFSVCLLIWQRRWAAIEPIFVRCFYAQHTAFPKPRAQVRFLPGALALESPSSLRSGLSSRRTSVERGARATRVLCDGHSGWLSATGRDARRDPRVRGRLLDLSALPIVRPPDGAATSPPGRLQREHGRLQRFRPLVPWRRASATGGRDRTTLLAESPPGIPRSGAGPTHPHADHGSHRTSSLPSLRCGCSVRRSGSTCSVCRPATGSTSASSFGLGSGREPDR